MKRIISFLILSAMLICAFVSALPVIAATPTGTAIGSASEFLAMTQSGKYYLSNDITISSSYANTFKGTLDGNGYKIIIAEGSNVSPFSQIAGATFKNLTVEGVINVTSRTTYGGISPLGYGNFENVTVKVGISAMVVDSFTGVAISQGGFIGKVSGNCTFTNCTNEGSVTLITTAHLTDADTAGIGGFAGALSTANATVTFNNCINNASMVCHEPDLNVGGFVGVSRNTTVNMTKCTNNGFIVGTSSTNHRGIGGFFGTVSNADHPTAKITLKTCKNAAKIEGNGSYGHVGGIIGRLSSVHYLTLEDINNQGSVTNTVTKWEGVGGLVGIMGDTSESSTGVYLFKDCINLSGVAGYNAGGMVGFDSSLHGVTLTFLRCVNKGAVSGRAGGYAGGIIGRADSKYSALEFDTCLNIATVTTADGGYGVGGIAGNVGSSGITHTPTFTNCVNTGNITCKTTLTEAGNVVAAGIMARCTAKAAKITNCINLGTLSNTAVSTNIAPIAPSYNSISHSVSGCSYLSGSGGSAVWGESAKSFSAIRTNVVSVLTADLQDESAYYNYRNTDSTVNSVGEGVDAVNAATTVAEVGSGAMQIVFRTKSLVLLSTKKDEKIASLGTAISNSDETYTAESYAAYTTAFNEIKADINVAADASALDAINVSTRIKAAEAKLVTVFSVTKTEKLAELGDKISNSDSTYTNSTYSLYSADYDSILASINAATTVDALEVIDVSTLKSDAEAKLVTVEAKKAELLTALGAKKENSGAYTAQSYTEYSAAYDAILGSINNGGADVDLIDVDTLKADAEVLLENSQVSENDTITELNGSATIDVNAYISGSGENQPLYSVDVIWGDITFVYNEDSVMWDPEKHEYSSTGESGWSDTSREITVVNHSDADIAVDITFEQAATPNGTANLTVVTPNFTLKSAVGTLVEDAPRASTEISVTGVPATTGSIGKLTVAVSKPVTE